MYNKTQIISDKITKLITEVKCLKKTTNEIQKRNVKKLTQPHISILIL